MIAKDWFSAQECADLLGMSKAGFIKMAVRKEYKNRPRQGRGGGLEYHYSSLPIATQEALLRAESREIMAQAAPVPAAVSTALTVQPAATDIARKAEGDAKAALITGRAQVRMDAKREILALIETVKRAGGNVETAVVDYNAGRLEASPDTRAALPSVSIPSVYLWFRQINGYGLSRLAGRYGNRLGSGIIDTYPQLAAALRAFLLEYPHAHAKHAHEWLKARYDLDWNALPAEIAGDGPIPMPGISAVGRWIKRWKQENAELYTLLSNPDLWKNKYMIGWGDMSECIIRPNQVWEFDSTPADVLLEDGRHSIIGVIDLYTRRVKLHVSKTSRSAAIAHVLKRALVGWGVLEIAKTDNGQDYVAKHISRIFQALGIEHQISAPFCPWQKPFIERFFRTFSHDLLELLPGYIGHNVADREALRARQQFSDRLFVKDRTVELPGVTAAALQDFCDRWVTGYHNRPHRGLKGRTPQQRIDAWPTPLRALPDPRVLDLLLLEAPGGDGWRTVTKAYGVRVDNFEYMAAELGLFVGERVRVLYDPEDAAHVHCFDERGGSIALAECPELTGTSRKALAAAAKTAQLQKIRGLKREARREAKTVSTRDALEVLLAQREAAAPVVFPPPIDPYTTPAVDGAAAALAGETALSGGEITPENVRDAWGDFAAVPAIESTIEPPAPAPAGKRRDFDTLDEAMRARVDQELGQGQPLDDDDIAFVAEYYRETQSTRIFENLMSERYGAERFRAWKKSTLAKAQGARQKTA